MTPSRCAPATWRLRPEAAATAMERSIMNDSMALGQSILAGQPFSQYIGARLTWLGKGEAELRVLIRHELLQQDGFVHGGVLSYACDNCLTFAAGSVLGSAVVTSEFKINYLRPAVGSELVARASVVHAGKSQAVCRCDVSVLTDEGKSALCATSQGTVVRIGQATHDAR
jgi:uncharacterized protein (TIGR00369 family)